MPRISIDVLEHLAGDVIRSAGGAGEDADVVAEALVWADARGPGMHGLHQLPILVRRLRLGLIRSPANMICERTAAATAVLDADDGFGQVAARRAMDEAIALAGEHGLGLCTVRHSNHYGAAGYYCARAADRGFIGMTWSNSMPKVAPHGGARRLMGTNPFAFACPYEPGRPVIVDFATSASNGSSVSGAERNGGSIPDGIALDAAGRPTTDPRRVNDGGCLLPAGGAKGYGLALAVEIMAGVLSGALVAPHVGSMIHDLDRPAGTGHAFLVLDVKRFLPLQDFLARLHQLLDAIKSVPTQDGVEEVLFPGERRARCAEDSATNGVLLSEEIYRGLTSTAIELGVPARVGATARAGDRPVRPIAAAVPSHLPGNRRRTNVVRLRHGNGGAP